MNFKLDTKILFVDDEISCHHFIEFMLDDIYSRSYQIKKAESGEDAIEIAEELTEKMDLLLLDFMLPDITGYELYLNLQQYEFTRDVPVIFQTGRSNIAQEPEIKLLIEQGKAGAIYKPYSKEDLFSAIVKLTDVNY